MFFYRLVTGFGGDVRDDDDDGGGALRRRVRVLRDGHGRVNGCVRLRVCVRVSDDALRLLYNRNLCTFSIPSYFLG